MATDAKHQKHTEEMVKNSKLEPSSKSSDSSLPPAKDGVLSDATSCISSVDAAGSMKESELDQESLTSEPTMYYPANNYCGYYYPGLANSYVDWNDPNYFAGGEGLETQQPVLQSDGGYMYYMPGFPPGYSPYNTYMPGAVIGADGQYLGQQPYVLSPVISQPLGSPGYFTPSLPYGSELIPAYSWDTTVWDGFNGNAFDGTLALPSAKTKSSSKMQPSKNNNSTAKSSSPVDKKGQSPVLRLPPGSEAPNQSLKPINKAPVLSKGYYPAAKMTTYTYQGKPGLLYPNTPVNIKDTGRNWVDAEKPKTRSKIGLGDFELLGEQNRGPRTNNSKLSWVPGVDQSGVSVADSGDNCGGKTVIIKRDDYNLPEFPTKHEHAMFFVIKSYSEDDIHKSIKYNVWASTPNGNKRLDNAYLTAQEKMNEKGSKCPVFLFFSVNASGQFCGVAEMIGRVDFNKNMDFWQQDKWNGFFPVKWHIIKDVPNPQFRHIILENNENKPVTNSRDTQEVKFPQGVEMLNIFKNFSSKTSILDDFVFYENRQKVMQEKRTKFYIPLEQMQPKVEETAQDQKAEDLNPIITGLESMDLGNGMKKKELQVAVVG